MLLNGDHGGPGALYYLCVITCEYHNETFAPALPFIHLGGLPEASDKLGILFPESGPPGTPGSCASHVGTTSLLFRDILPRWVLRARQTAKPGHFRSDMTFRQAMEHSGDSSKTASFLTLWDDVIEVPPNPKLYVYQRPIPVNR